jgi:hypothetical protein
MSIIKKVLDVEALKAQLEAGEVLQFVFKTNSTPHPNGSEHVNCKNGHWNFISNYMGFEPNTHTQIKCNECDEIIFEYLPLAVRHRSLDLIEVTPPDEPHSCKLCKELSQTFHPDDDWFCRKGHVGGNIKRTNECPDFEIKIKS